uniref:Integrase catalytic domain-containing protein n=1 Tax=Tanacetum cinerariifolium TaxID=118510 RepID=A0A699H1Q0_TANCI|nr:hypothetical protein [Tanacetum cinerariifolium]
MQSQTSNTLHNSIMEAGSKDRPPMLASGNYVQWKSRIKRYIDTKPNHELIHHCLKNPPYKFTWADKEVPISKDSPVTRTELYMETYKIVSQEIRYQLNAEAEAVQIILTGIDNDIYSTVDACPITCKKPKWVKDAAYHRENMLFCKQEEAGIQLNTEQDDWRDDTNDVLKDHELEVPYMYMAQLQEVSPDADDSGPIFDAEPLQKVSNDCHYNVFAIESEHPKQSESIHDTYPIEQDEHNMIIDSLDISYDREQIDQNDDHNDLANDHNDLANEHELLASLITKLKCKIYENKNRNNFLETSNKKSQAELARRNDVEYASKVEIDCAKARGDLISYKMESQKSFNKYTQTINDLNQMILEMKNKLSAHQETISILSQQKEAQIKVYKTREDKELDKVIALENKVTVLDNIIYKTGQSVQTMNMLNNKCRTSLQILTPESDKVIRLEKESRSKLSDLIRPFDYDKLNNIYDLFVPQREKSSEQRYFSKRTRLSHTPVKKGNSKESFNKQTTLLEKRLDESISWDQKCNISIELFKIKSSVGTIFDEVERCKKTIAKRTYFGHIDLFIRNTIEANFSQEIRRINAGLEQFHVCLNEEMVADLRYFNSFELEVDSPRSQLETQKTQFLNEIDRLSREYYYDDHMNAILGVYTELDEVTNLQCDYLELLKKCKCLENELSKSKIMSKSFKALQKHVINLEIDLQQCQEKIKNDKSFKENQSKEFHKEHEQYFKIQDLQAQLQDKDSLERKDFSKSKSKSVTQNNVSNDFSKPITTQTLPPNKKSILKNTNMLAPRMYKLHTEPTQFRTSQLPQDSRKTNKRVSFSTGDVEDHRRSSKFSKKKTSITACNDSLKAKTLNVNFVCATCGKCVLNDKHDMCVLKSVNGVNSMTKMPIDVLVSTREPKCTAKQSVAKPLKKTVASESNQKPRNITRKLYERVSKACSWWYPKFTPSGYKWRPKSEKENVNPNVVEIVLFFVESGCSKHMTGNLMLLINFVEKFLGTVKFGNDQIAPILGYGDLVQGAVMIKWVYYVEGLNHNLFSVGQFYDVDLEVAFKKSTCYIHDLKGNDLLTSSRGTDLYSITLQDTNSPNLICLMAKATSSQACNRALLTNFVEKFLETVRFGNNDFAAIADYGDVETQVNLQLQVQHVLTDNGTEFKNKTLDKFFDEVGISQQFYAAKTPQQNGVVERRNRTLVEAARTMLTFTNLPLFLWAEAIATTFFKQNRSIIHKHFDKTPYELMNKRKPYIKFFRMFRCRCYLLNNYDDVGKLKAKGDIRVFVGYSKEFVAFRIYNKQTRKIHESVNVNFDEISEMASKQFSLEPDLSNLNETGKSLNPTVSQKSLTNVETSNNEEEVFHEVSKSFQGESSSSSLNDEVSIEPANVAEALRDADWVSAMEDELDQFARLKTTFLNEILKEEVGFQKDSIDTTLFIKEKDLMVKRFEISMIGEMKFFLGLQVNKISNGIFINQSKYILDILKRIGMENYDIVPTPMVEQAKLKLDLVGKPIDHANYRSMIGSLMYVTLSRPDIMFSTCMCARYQANPNEHHVSAVKRIFRYLKGTINLGLWYSKDSGLDLTAYLDADHAGCHLDRKSTSGSV